MNKSILNLILGSVCAGLLLASTANAQTTKPKPAEAKVHEAAAEKPKRDWYPFSGTVTNVDKTAKTITLAKKEGERVLHTDGNTTFEMNGKPASIADIKAGYYVSGTIHQRASKEDNEVIQKAVIRKEAPAHKPRNQLTPAAEEKDASTNAPVKKKKVATDK